MFLILPLLTGCITPDKKDIDTQHRDIEISLQKTQNWLIKNINEKDIFNYKYDPITEEYSTTNNMIRQLMASRVLAEMSKENISLQPLHQKNLDFVFTYWYKEENDFGYIYYSNKSKLGAISMALRTLIYSPFYENYTSESENLANTILDLQNENGSFEPWYIEPDYEYDKDYLLTFYSGEAILSLVEMYEKTDNTSYLDAVIKSQDFYIDRYVVNLEDNYYPAYVPWHTISLNKLYKITKNETYANAIFTLNDKLLEIQNTDRDSEYLGRFYSEWYPEYGSPHSSSDAVYTEGLAYAYEIAKLINDTYHQERYKNAINLSIDNLMNLQYNSSDSRINGAIRINADDMKIRVDTTQHAIDAFRKIIEVFDY